MNKTDSPCIRQCELNEQKFCIACYRSISEIMNWRNKASKERLEIVELCEQRKKSSLIKR